MSEVPPGLGGPGVPAAAPNTELPEIVDPGDLAAPFATPPSVELPTIESPAMDHPFEAAPLMPDVTPFEGAPVALPSRRAADDDVSAPAAPPAPAAPAAPSFAQNLTESVARTSPDIDDAITLSAPTLDAPPSDSGPSLVEPPLVDSPLADSPLADMRPPEEASKPGRYSISAEERPNPFAALDAIATEHPLLAPPASPAPITDRTIPAGGPDLSVPEFSVLNDAELETGGPEPVVPELVADVPSADAAFMEEAAPSEEPAAEDLSPARPPVSVADVGLLSFLGLPAGAAIELVSDAHAAFIEANAALPSDSESEALEKRKRRREVNTAYASFRLTHAA